MKKIIPIILLAALAIPALAQNLSLVHNSTPITNGAVININGSVDSTLYVYVSCVNNSSDSIAVKVRKAEIVKVFGSENTFCWTNCYVPSIFVSPDAITLQAGATTTSFSGEYKAKGNEGQTTVRYTFFNVDNANDTVSVVVNYNAASAGIKDISYSPEFSHAYPNPADAYTGISYKIRPDRDTRIIIRNMIGDEVFSGVLDATAGYIRINTSDMREGVYFYTVFSEGKAIVTRKLVVKH